MIFFVPLVVKKKKKNYMHLVEEDYFDCASVLPLSFKYSAIIQKPKNALNSLKPIHTQTFQDYCQSARLQSCVLNTT